MPNFASLSPTPPKTHRLLTTAIEKREVLRFTYEGEPRVVEPQTFGMDWDGEDVLRAYPVSGEGASGPPVGLKLFLIGGMSGLRKTGQTFQAARPGHNPNDSAMRTIYATLE